MKKLDLIKKRDEENKGQQIVSSVVKIDQVEQVKAIESVKKSIDNLYEFMNGKEDYDFDKLAKQLDILHSKLDFTPILEGLEKLSSKPEPTVKALEIKDFQKLLQAVEKNKPVPVELTKLEKAIIEVKQRIQESSVIEQAPEEYQPVRRVVKLGNRLIFDDQPTPSRSGGGGGVANPDVMFAKIALSGAGTDTLVAATSKHISVVGYVVVFPESGTVTFKSGTTAITGAMSFAANGGAAAAGTEHFPVFQTAIGEALNITTTGSGAQGHLSYILE